ncbi:MAG TPA: class I SAM-dependent methyltransferase [Anaeromyxobacter sp.]|nr:class I SAM-dependent methyltransferase [Anaeromyxobacter sp.]
MPVPRWLAPDRPAPGCWHEVGDQTRAEAALELARRRHGLLYRGSYHGARQLLAGMGRRLRPHPSGSRRARATARDVASGAGASALTRLFLASRESARLEHEVLARLAVPIGVGYAVELARAPDVRAACEEALGPATGAGALPLRDLLGMVGAHEWRRRGVHVPALGARVHPHHGVFAPIRGEYVDLVARAAERWPVAGKRALDLGTGTGVLAFVLARRGARVLATDLEPRAVACARENAARLGLEAAVEVCAADLFPGEAADLVVCNPPWLPADAFGPLDRAVYDPGGAFLARLVAGLPSALGPGGEAWIVISDLAERLGLRPAGHLAALAAKAGLRVTDVLETRPAHPRARDREDPLHEARAAEIVRLLRLTLGAPP